MAFAKNEIRHAIENREFVPYFQPLVDLRSGTLEGFEILARWHHPTCGLVPPPEFIPLIEREAHAERFEVGGDGAGEGEVVEKGAFGDFHGETAEIEDGIRSETQEECREGAVVEL